MSVSSDEWFNRYKFCQPIGQGGMGTIYLAEDKQNGNSVCVVKQLITKQTDIEELNEAVRLFKREANLLRRFDHPGIVRFFDDHITDDGKYFLVMDYVPGKNLDKIVSTYGPFNSEATVEIAIQCCEVLEYMHEQDPPIIYRDLKPSNLMLTPEGQIIFIDFGIARSFAPKQSATRVVTAGYSPPEQYFGKPEIRSDLYALGATLGHLLTGQRPKPLTPSTPKYVKTDVMTSLDGLVRRLTSHSPEDRPSSARQVRYELYRIYHEIHPDFEIPEEALIAAQRKPQPRQRIPSSVHQAAQAHDDDFDDITSGDSDLSLYNKSRRNRSKPVKNRISEADESLFDSSTMIRKPRPRRRNNDGFFQKLVDWWEQFRT